MQHRLKRGRGFIIRNANREAAALRVPPVFEGGARINDDAARTFRTSEQPPPNHHPAARSSAAYPGLRPQTFVSHCNPTIYKY